MVLQRVRAAGGSAVPRKDYPQVEATVAAFRNRFPTSPLLYHADELLGRSYIKQAKFPDARASLTKVINSE